VRRGLATACTALVLLAACSVALGDAPEPPPSDSLVQSPNADERLWPHTSKSRSAAGRTLAINVVVDGDPDRLRDLLLGREDRNWTSEKETRDRGNGSVRLPGGNVSIETNPDDNVTLNVTGTRVTWASAHGARRYTYVESTDSGGQWLTEAYQVNAGEYLGTRRHVRVFTPPSGEWAALQAHGEWWDWFRLRHTVTETSETRSVVESDLSSQPGVVRIESSGGVAGQSDTGPALVTLATLVLVVGGRRRATTAWRRLSATRRRELRLAGVVAGVVLGVRGAGIGLEQVLPWLHPKIPAAVLYPVLAVGLPVAVYRSARGVTPLRAFGATAVAAGVSLGLDFAVVGTGVPPPGTALHRIGMALAVGTVAAAGAAGAGSADARVARALGAVGVGCWVVGLGLALFGL